ncbi:MAG: phosphopantetheine-binding protein [Xenococcaceae cyanobacterium MO_207.B15]|nr:phosphopantetheine-binding protein [Xenococcaceae cyanobacterium MO_207.B15]
MTVENQNYELHILNYAINKYIDNILPSNSQDALNIIIYQSDELVWIVTTEIYTKSGYKIDFSTIKNVLDLRIETLTSKIAEEEEIKKLKAIEQEKRRAELEAQRLAKEAEEKRRRAELEVQRLAKKAKEKEIKEQKFLKKEEENRKKEEKFTEFKKAYPNIDIEQQEIFIEIQKAVTAQLGIDQDQVTLDSHIVRDLKADYYDAIEIVMALEEEFEIEISEDILDEVQLARSCDLSLKDVSIKDIFKEILYLVSQQINN